MLIDLSVPINSKTPVYPGDPNIEIQPTGQLKRDGFNDHRVSIGTHAGTHIDAPIHMIEGGKALSDYDIDKYVGDGILIDARPGFNEQIKQVEIAPGDIVLILTGWSKRFDEPKYFKEFEPIPDDWSDLLIQKQVSMVGMDMGSPDKPPFKIHKKLLKNDILIIENLSNLEALVGKKFRVIALPIKLEIDAAPARVIAEILP
ncbi:MAG: cyclase family protein [Candidatus Saccharimonadales bacterium]|nr:cyclase family protein [Candidatus Saccharimonadales bacterium]